jgi:hypothetical protein
MPQSNPKETIGIGKPWPSTMSREDKNLLPQSQVFPREDDGVTIENGRAERKEASTIEP